MSRTIAALVIALGPSIVSAQQPTPEQRKAMIEKTQAGPEHQMLASLEGRWTIDVVYSMGTGKSMKTRGTATNKMVLGGRFLLSETSSAAPPGAPATMSSIDTMNIYGFDRRTNEFTIIELDTMGTYWVSASGPAKPDKTIVMSGESLDDHSGKKEVRKYDMVLRVIDADTYVTEIVFKFPNRPDVKLVEKTFRRVK